MNSKSTKKWIEKGLLNRLADSLTNLVADWIISWMMFFTRFLSFPLRDRMSLFFFITGMCDNFRRVESETGFCHIVLWHIMWVQERYLMMMNNFRGLMMMIMNCFCGIIGLRGGVWPHVHPGPRGLLLWVGQ